MVGFELMVLECYCGLVAVVGFELMVLECYYGLVAVVGFELVVLVLLWVSRCGEV